MKKGYTLFPKNDEKKSIAFPPLSTLLGMPSDKAANIAVASVLNYIKNNSQTYEEIQFVVEEEKDFNYYKNLLDEFMRNS